MPIDDTNRRSNRMKLGDAFVRTALAIVEIAGIGFQGLPENDGILSKPSGFERAWRDPAEPAHRPIHEVTGQLLRAATPRQSIRFVQRTTIQRIAPSVPEQ